MTLLNTSPPPPLPPAGLIPLDPGLVSSWLQELPQLLWELGSAAPGMTHRALQLLLTAGRCSTAGSATAFALCAMQPQLAPLFVLQRPHKAARGKQGPDGGSPGGGAAAAAGGQDCATAAAACPLCSSSSGQAGKTAVLLPGPLLRWPTHLQLLAIDVIYHLGAGRGLWYMFAYVYACVFACIRVSYA